MRERNKVLGGSPPSPRTDEITSESGEATHNSGGKIGGEIDMEANMQQCWTIGAGLSGGDGRNSGIRSESAQWDSGQWSGYHANRFAISR